jgi:hypothetical protein
MKIDFYASERHFVDHLVPIWRALPDSIRGDFAVPWRRVLKGLDGAQHAKNLGIDIVDALGPENRPTLTASVANLRNVIDKQGRTRAALIEHGTGQSFGGDPKSAKRPSHPGGDNRPASLFLAPNAHAANRDAQAYPDAQTAVIGCPKLDDLPARAPLTDKPTIAVSFHWDSRTCKETRSGFREFKYALPMLVKEYRVIGHGHPRAIDGLSLRYHRFGIEVVRDFRDVVSQAHVYVNEGSSTLFEAASTGIPVVVLNPSFFRKDVHHGLRFWDASEVGVNVNTIDYGLGPKLGKGLLDAVEVALKDPPQRQEAREAALDIMYAYRTGATRRAVDTLMEWAEPRKVRKAA